jgi:hypothetical protein
MSFKKEIHIRNSLNGQNEEPGGNPMSFKISCPHCARTLSVTEPAFGKTVSCPGCNQPLQVPYPPQPSRQAGHVAAPPPWSGAAQNGDATPNDPLGFLHSDADAAASPADRWPSQVDGFAASGGAPTQLPASMPSLPDLGAPGRPSFPSAFPKGTPSGFLDFFDFGFKRYLTPWIVRHVWLWAVCLLGLGLMIQVAMYVQKSLPTRETVSLPIPPDARMRKGFLDDLIRNKERPEVAETPNNEFPRAPGNFRPGPGVAPRREPEADWRDEYSKMTLRKLKAERTSLDENFPETGTRWTAWSIFYLASAAAAVLGTTLTLIILRVICELIIVVFHIAASLTTIANNTALSGKSSRD